jgi:hypothetical protein
MGAPEERGDVFNVAGLSEKSWAPAFANRCIVQPRLVFLPRGAQPVD